MTPSKFASALDAVRDNVIVYESWPDAAAKMNTPAFRVKIKIGVQEFSLMYEAYDRENAEAYAALLRKGLEYLVAGIASR